MKVSGFGRLVGLVDLVPPAHPTCVVASVAASPIAHPDGKVDFKRFNMIGGRVARQMRWGKGAE